MSEFEVDTPLVDPKTKAAKPDLYDGKREELTRWLLQLDLYFHASGKEWEDKEKVILAATYMRGPASDWIGPHLSRYLNEENQAGDVVDALIEDYDAFRNGLKQLFGVTNQTAIAERAIQQLRQTRSTAEYAAEFQHHACQLKWDDIPLMIMYKQGLKPKVREELLRSGAECETLKQLYDESIRLDAEWYNLHQELKRKTPIHASYGGSYTQTKHHTPPQRQSTSSYGYEPMQGVQYNKMEKGKGRGPGPHRPNHGRNSGTPRRQGQQPHSTEKRSCYACGKPGHIAKNCRSKNKVRRQINMLRVSQKEAKDPEDQSEEEWDIVDNISELHLEPISPKTPNPENDETTLVAEDTTVGRLYKDPESEPEDEWYEPIQRQPTPHPDMVPREPKAKNSVQTNDIQPRDTADMWAQPFNPSESVWKYLAEDTCLGYNRHKDKLQGEETEIHNHRRRQLIVTHQDRQWADMLYEQRRGRTNYKNERPNYQPNYLLDHRNLLHGNLQWTSCDYSACPLHLQDKVQFKKWPVGMVRCRWEWFDCPINQCDQHLWDKRTTRYFPTASDAQNTAMGLLVNDECTQFTWHTCMNSKCGEHRKSKEENGFQEPEQNTERKPDPNWDMEPEPSTTRWGSMKQAPTLDDKYKARRTPEERRRRLHTAYRAPELSFLGQGSEEKTLSEK